MYNLLDKLSHNIVSNYLAKEKAMWNVFPTNSIKFMSYLPQSTGSRVEL